MYIYFAIVSFIIGALLGSFFNVCIYRIPNKKSVVNPPSHCYNCNTRLKPLDLVPILSWTLLRGKCRYCGQKISPRYALVELLTGIFGSVGAVIFNILGQGISIKDSLLGGLICGGGMLVLIYLIELIIKKEVMGGGDIKLFGMVGLFLGIKLGLLTILLSVYVGAIYGVATIIYSKIKKKEFNSMIPYGPFISVGALISILYGTNIINWYIGLF